MQYPHVQQPSMKPFGLIACTSKDVSQSWSIVDLTNMICVLAWQALAFEAWKTAWSPMGLINMTMICFGLTNMSLSGLKDSMKPNGLDKHDHDVFWLDNMSLWGLKDNMKPNGLDLSCGTLRLGHFHCTFFANLPRNPFILEHPIAVKKPFRSESHSKFIHQKETCCTENRRHWFQINLFMVLLYLCL